MTENDLKAIDKALSILKVFEGCRLTAYKDQGGVWTIGFGSTGSDIKQGTQWTIAEACNRLENNVYTFYRGLDSLLHVDLNVNQKAALISLTYNIGLRAFSTSSLLRKLNNYKEGAADEFYKWIRVNGSANAGLISRRIKERELFLTPVSD